MNKLEKQLKNTQQTKNVSIDLKLTKEDVFMVLREEAVAKQKVIVDALKEKVEKLRKEESALRRFEGSVTKTVENIKPKKEFKDWLDARTKNSVALYKAELEHNNAAYELLKLEYDKAPKVKFIKQLMRSVDLDSLLKLD